MTHFVLPSCIILFVPWQISWLIFIAIMHHSICPMTNRMTHFYCHHASFYFSHDKTHDSCTIIFFIHDKPHESICIGSMHHSICPMRNLMTHFILASCNIIFVPWQIAWLRSSRPPFYKVPLPSFLIYFCKMPDDWLCELVPHDYPPPGIWNVPVQWSAPLLILAWQLHPKKDWIRPINQCTLSLSPSSSIPLSLP